MAKLIIDEKFVKENIVNCANEIIGGEENVMMDYPKTSEEYKAAESFLNDFEAVKSMIIAEVTQAVYKPGHTHYFTEKSAKKMTEIFKTFPLLKWTEEILKKDFGYEA